MSESIQDIYDISKFTTVDYPGMLACIIWMSSCNLRCRFCYNKDLVQASSGKYGEAYLREFLKSHVGFLDAVVFSGGECTLSANLSKYAKYAKDAGYKVKIDTNGTSPNVVQNLVASNLVDYIAMDYKAPREKFSAITGKPEVMFDQFEKTLLYLLSQSQVPFEVRTTVHTDLLTEEDINGMVRYLNGLGYTGSYYIQGYKDAPTIGDMRAQVRSLDKTLIHNTEKIQVIYRNL